MASTSDGKPPDPSTEASKPNRNPPNTNLSNIYNPYKKNHKNSSPTAMIIDTQPDTQPDTSPTTPPDTLTDTDNDEWTTVQRKSKTKQAPTKYNSDLNHKNDSEVQGKKIYGYTISGTYDKPPKMTDDDTEMTDNESNVRNDNDNWAAAKLKNLLSTEDNMDTDSVDTQITQNTTEILESFSNQDTQIKKNDAPITQKTAVPKFIKIRIL